MADKTLATVVWKNADTYDVFKAIWRVGGLTLSDTGKADKRENENGTSQERTQRIAVPTKQASELERKLHLLDETSRLLN
jgi:hypothetical protein